MLAEVNINYAHLNNFIRSIMDKKDRPIGVFDSGIGGLTVLKEIIKELPNEGTIYLGDTARVPYGIRSPETVIRYSLECMRFLVKKDIKLLVVACNTASAISIHAMRKESPVPVIGVIGPGAMAAIKASAKRKIGVIGTETTIKSRTYLKAIKKIDSDVHVISKPCPLFVPLVEEGWVEGKIVTHAALKYLSGFKRKGIDTLLLGCTHYPLLKNTLSKVMGDGVRLIDSAVETVKKVRRTLSNLKIKNNTGKKPQREFYVTDFPERFIKVGERFLGQKIEHMEKVTVGN
jgi:glutamate racemase